MRKLFSVLIMTFILCSFFSSTTEASWLSKNLNHLEKDIRNEVNSSIDNEINSIQSDLDSNSQSYHFRHVSYNGADDYIEVVNSNAFGGNHWLIKESSIHSISYNPPHYTIECQVMRYNGMRNYGTSYYRFFYDIHNRSIIKMQEVDSPSSFNHAQITPALPGSQYYDMANICFMKSYNMQFTPNERLLNWVTQ